MAWHRMIITREVILQWNLVLLSQNIAQEFPITLSSPCPPCNTNRSDLHSPFGVHDQIKLAYFCGNNFCVC